MVSHLFTNGDTDPRAGAACILALAQQMRRYQVSGAQLQVAVVLSGDVSRWREGAEGRLHARVCHAGRGTGETVLSLARARPGRNVHARMHAQEERA